MQEIKSPKHFFIADLHMSHKSILTLCSRKFPSIEEHDKHVIDSINSVVANSDFLYILGDLGFHKDLVGLRNFLKSLNGQKHIILGNHDHLAHLVQLKRENVIADVKETKTVQVDGYKVNLCHFPLREWKDYYRGGYHFHGHTHNTLPDYELSTDVGVDSKGFIPLDFYQLKEYLESNRVDSNITSLDKRVNEFFPNLSAHYFVNLCTGNEEIRNKIMDILIRDGKSIGLTKE